MKNVIRLSNAIQNGKQLNKTEENISLNKNHVIENNSNSEKHHYNWLKLTHAPLNVKVKFPTTSWFQFCILVQRLFTQILRNKKALAIQALHYLLCSLLVGAVYYDNANDGSMIYNHLKFSVGIIMFFSHTRLFIPILLFPSDVKTAKTQHFNRWYGLTPYYFATIVANLPIHLILNTVYISIVYYLTGLPRVLWRFVMYIIIGNAVSLSTEGLGFAVGATFNVLNGSIIGSSITVPFLCLAIYGVDFAKEVSIVMKVIMHTSPMRCGLAALLIVTFGYGRAPLNCDEIYCHFADPKVLKHYLDGTEDEIFIALPTLFFIILFYRILAYVSLRIRFST